ncbi:hypothetical protein JAAARDRAFT_75787 [Jaapia argillacea MUCL 33604]|uniref:Homeobox domain-containing protein n=1 Tax=Jaapia argillacea MUCL 33604 TaxID=933084 RepID=A0A067QB60_9AGAM|nr:hypothetical protein JAAARDRAFT_75787 [Jaapia argillacea MUCL 33604]
MTRRVTRKVTANLPMRSGLRKRKAKDSVKENITRHTRMTKEQLVVLNGVFIQNRKPSKADKEELAKQLSCLYEKVDHWFANKREKCNRELRELEERQEEEKRELRNKRKMEMKEAKGNKNALGKLEELGQGEDVEIIAQEFAPEEIAAARTLCWLRSRRMPDESTSSSPRVP